MYSTRDPKVISPLEQAAIKLGGTPEVVKTIFELFVIKALKAGIKF